jgi:hypothetical protein
MDPGPIPTFIASAPFLIKAQQHLQLQYFQLLLVEQDVSF